jgi:hypothetical protein
MTIRCEGGSFFSSARASGAPADEAPMMRMLRSSEGIAIVRGVAVEAIARGGCCRAGVGQVTGGWFGPGRDGLAYWPS